MKPPSGPTIAALRKKAKKVADTSAPGLALILYLSAKRATDDKITRPAQGK
jgi:hypothetical protein